MQAGDNLQGTDNDAMLSVTNLTAFSAWKDQLFTPVGLT